MPPGGGFRLGPLGGWRRRPVRCVTPPWRVKTPACVVVPCARAAGAIHAHAWRSRAAPRMRHSAGARRPGLLGERFEFRGRGRRNAGADETVVFEPTRGGGSRGGGGRGRGGDDDDDGGRRRGRRGRGRGGDDGGGKARLVDL